jgi:hypothetical protein
MTKKAIPIVLALTSLGLSRPVPNSVVGTWKLFSYSDTSPSGMLYFPFGAPPIGQFVFTADGHFSAGVECNPNDGSIPDNLPVPEFDDLTRPYMGYFGTYKFDPATGDVSFNVSGASAPSYVNSTVSSHIRFDGDHLIMTGSAIRKNGKRWTWERILMRE